MQSSKGYALFDLDHTLLPFDTQALFCAYVLRRSWWRRFYLFVFLPCVPLVAIRLMSIRTIKRVYLSYLWGMRQKRLNELCADFAKHVAQSVAYPDLLAEVRRHQSEGRTTILNSASPAFYVEAIARELGFDHCVGTAVELRDPMPMFPMIHGANNKHGAKIDRMIDEELLPKDFKGREGEHLPDSWGYSDSSADIPLLSICEHGVMIHPSTRFSAIGLKRGWSSVKPPRPYKGKWGSRIASVLQALGLWGG